MTTSHPNVLIRPPLVYALAYVTGGLIDKSYPYTVFPDGVLDGVRKPLAVVIAALSLSLFIACMRAFRRHRTTVSTRGTPSALIQDGPFRFSRNPVYVALTLLYVAAAFWNNNGPALAMLAPALVVMQKGVVEREEKFLAEHFGEAYTAYTKRVRRWL